MPKKIIKQLLVGAAIVGLALFARTKFERFTIPQNGMAPNYPAGSTYWASKGTFTADNLGLGDVVLFHKHKGSTRYNFVCRVIGLPGNEISISGQELRVAGSSLGRELQLSENGVDVILETLGDAKYLVSYDNSFASDYEFATDLTVPEGHVFVVGDNRYNSQDSRHYGPVPISTVFGRLRQR